MDITFYVLLVLACLVVLLAMWACAGSSTRKWGPDLTLELPPHLLQQALFGHANSSASGDAKQHEFKSSVIPSAPSEHPYDPLLSNEHPPGKTRPPPLPPKPHRPAPARPKMADCPGPGSPPVRALPPHHANPGRSPSLRHIRKAPRTKVTSE